MEITASDKNSGNVTIEYLISDKKLTDFKQMAFLPYSGELHIGDSYLNKDGRYIIYARLSDASGNVRYISSDGIVVDNTAPVISGITDGKIYCEAQIVSVEEANLDNTTVNGNPVTLTDGKCTLNPADGEQTVVVTDKVGNTASVTVTVNDGHTPLADDNDCTTPVLCSYCNAVITAAKQHDFTGALQSNETGHWHQCQNDGCTVCDTKASHTGNPEWETTETQHTKKYSCCGYVTVKTEEHEWKDGVCEVCGYRYVSGGSTAPEDDVKTTADSATSGTTTSTTVKDTKTETVKNEQGEDISKITAKVSDKVADKLVEQAVSNKSDTVEITVKSDNGNKAEQIEIEIPKKAVESIAKDTEADLVIKTDIGQVTLDNKTLETMAAEAEGDTVRLVVNENTQLKEAQKSVLDIIGDRGHIFDLGAIISGKYIHDFRGGRAHITLPMPEKLKGKDIVIIYINDKGICEILNHTMETVGAEEYIKFTTSHFSNFAVVEKADAEKLIAKQNADKINSLTKEAKLKATTSKTTKKSIKVKIGEAKNSNSLIKEAKAIGYTVKYKFYRSTKKSSKYIALKTKDTDTYINTAGKKGTKYYYKAMVLVYDGKTLIAQTELKQCRYGVRSWNK